MKLDLKLLATRFFQAEDEPLAPEDGVNRYLLEQVLRPAMEGKTLYLRDIDFSAFELDDIEALGLYYDSLMNAARNLNRFSVPVSQSSPAPGNARVFC